MPSVASAIGVVSGAQGGSASRLPRFGDSGEEPRYFQYLAGSQHYALQTTVNLVASDVVVFRFATFSSGASQFLCDFVEFDAGDLIQLTNCTATIDGSPIADGADMSSYADGKLHELACTMTGAQNMTVIGQSGSSSGYFVGWFEHLDVAGAHAYDFNSNNLLTLDDAIGGNTLSLNNFTSDHIAEYTWTTNAAGSNEHGWLGPELTPDPSFDAAGLWWSQAGAPAVSGGKLVCNTPTASAQIRPSSTGLYDDRLLIGGGQYVWRATCDTFTSQSVVAYLYSEGPQFTVTGAGTFSAMMTPAPDSSPGFVDAAGNAVLTLSDTSIKRFLEVAY